MCLAVPVQIEQIFDDRTATVDLSGVKRRVSLVMTPGAQVGDYVLLHTGFAISVLDPAEAAETLRLFEELIALQEAPDEIH